MLASALAVFVSIYSGVSTNFYLAAGCYLLATACVATILRRGRPARGPIESQAVSSTVRV